MHCTLRAQRSYHSIPNCLSAGVSRHADTILQTSHVYFCFVPFPFPSCQPPQACKKRAFKLAIHQVFNPYALASSHAIAFHPSFLESLATSGLRPANGIQPTAAAHPGLLPGSGALPLACPSPPIDYSLHLLSQKKNRATEHGSTSRSCARSRAFGNTRDLVAAS